MRVRWTVRACAMWGLTVVVAVSSCRPVVVVDPPPVATAPPTRAESTVVVTAPPVRAEPPRSTPPRAVPVLPVVSEIAPDITREFRGVWVASVANIDWPSSRSLSTAEQQRELIALLDRASALKLNAVIFQVRPAADAFYASKIEPWSVYLTGEQGRAPDPYWDPLEFVVREAHARNLELHAWFNPYRARHEGKTGPLAPNHIARTNPSLVKTYGDFLWMDPGEKAVRARTLRVVLDVVTRYDIDGVHLDDYFYPYPETTKRGREIAFPDAASYQRYRKEGGTLAKADWRRRNVDLLVRELHDGIHKTKPWVRFGISPFGIWRPGYPEQIRGLDAYSKLYADARKWLREGWVDYFTPQLYWPTTKPAQSYPALLKWWVEENTQARHMWAGNFTSRAAGRGSSAFSVGELLEQIRVTRVQPGATGNVHFSMKSFLINQGGMNDSLMQGPYAQMAIVTASSWLTAAAPPTPALRLTDRSGTMTIVLSTVGPAIPWQWLVQVRSDTGWTSTVLPGDAAVFPVTDRRRSTRVTVRAISRVGVMSLPVSLSLTDAASSGPDAASASSRSAAAGSRDAR